jgi:integrase
MKLQEFFLNVYRPLRLRGKAAASSRLHLCAIRCFERFLERPATLADLDELTISRFLEHRAAIGRSPFTVERERCGLLALARLAAARRMIDQAPEVPQGILPREAPRAWSIEELGRLFAAAGQMPGVIGTVPAPLWWRALLAVLWETGARISEVLDAPADALQAPYLTISAASRKGGAAGKVYKLSTSTIAALERVRQPGGRLFPWDRCRATVWNRFRGLVRAAGLDAGRGSRFHAIRRSTASWIAAAGLDPVAAMGHSSAKITRLWYLDPRVADTGPRPCDVLPHIE